VTVRATKLLHSKNFPKLLDFKDEGLGGAFAFSGDHGGQLPRAQAVECFDNDCLDGILADRVDQVVARGELLQHVDSVVQIEFADDVEVRTGQHFQSISNRGRGKLAASPSGHVIPDLSDKWVLDRLAAHKRENWVNSRKLVRWLPIVIMLLQ
jgi:hypothetical protein